LLLSLGEASHISLTYLNLTLNEIQGAEDGRQVSLLLHHCPVLMRLHLNLNNLGPLGASALAPGLAATPAGASQLANLEISGCGLGNDGVTNLVPHGQANRVIDYNAS
jgi:Leucine Rich repeat